MVASEQAHGNLDKRETFSLIGSDKVEGTDVYRPGGERIGHIERLMLDKRGGKVAYAVMGFGGFMGLNEDYYPIPWSLLTYNEQLDGYEVDLSDAQLRGAPKFGANEDWDWADRSRAERVYAYYKVAPYWV